jgi:hypothetical protein
LAATASSLANRTVDLYAWAKAQMAIINRANELRQSSADPERDLLDFLSKPQTEPDMATICLRIASRLPDPRHLPPNRLTRVGLRVFSKQGVRHGAAEADSIPT